MTAALTEQIVQFMQHRCDSFVTTSLQDLFCDSEAFLDVPDSLVSALRDQRAEACALLARWQTEAMRAPEQHPVIVLMCEHARRFIKQNNQFVAVSPSTSDMLATVYDQWLTSLRNVMDDIDRPLPEALRAMLARHRLNLRNGVAALGLAPPRAGAGPLCREYSPELQIAMLHLDAWGVAGPLLDLGCGEHARLVRLLRQHNVRAYGLDAFAPVSEPYLVPGDWLAWSLGRARWQTIVSHMAFSHHFLHHHLTGSDASISYARRYMDVLAALRPGGSFIYTPGLPFMEDLLPREQFHVERRALTSVQGTHLDQALAGFVGQSTFYSVRVQRRSFEPMATNIFQG